MSTATIIIAEDDALLRSLLAMAVRHLRPDVRVLEAANGHIARELYEQHGADLLITDDHMPLLTGTDLVQALRQAREQVAILMLSSNEQARRLLPQDGRTVFVAKPVALPTLLVHIDHLLALA